MESFAKIFERAANRHGGEDALREKLGVEHYPHEYGEKSDDRWLSEFTRRVFQSGFSWKVVDAKWDGFEAAFWKFDPARCARIDLDDMETLTADKGIVRNPQKIKSVSQNAEMILAMAAQSGSADKFIRDWPSADFIGLLDYLNKHGSRLGPNTACYALRFSGVPSFILSKDVTAALIHGGVVEKAPTGKRAKKDVQEAFNIWAEQSGENLSFISRVLAHSIEG